MTMKSTVSLLGTRQSAKKASTLKALAPKTREPTRKYGRPTDEHPEANVRHIVKGIVRIGLKPIPTKSSISLRVDADVLDWFKGHGDGYQTRMNAVLRAFRDASV
jgi:uncharacterized protein (DUF4415 family)